MKSVYYLIHDNSVQWFTYIVDMAGDNVCEMIQVPNAVDGQFLSNIVQREMHFGNKIIRGDIYCGWSISKYEYDKLKEIIGLYPAYKRYLKLCHEN